MVRVELWTAVGLICAFLIIFYYHKMMLASLEDFSDVGYKHMSSLFYLFVMMTTPNANVNPFMYKV